jgi:hypothetical protein
MNIYSGPSLLDSFLACFLPSLPPFLLLRPHARAQYSTPNTAPYLAQLAHGDLPHWRRQPGTRQPLGQPLVARLIDCALVQRLQGVVVCWKLDMIRKRRKKKRKEILWSALLDSSPHFFFFFFF